MYRTVLVYIWAQIKGESFVEMARQFRYLQDDTLLNTVVGNNDKIYISSFILANILYC